jgi:hypothetical protein
LIASRGGEPREVRFACTPGGAVAGGRRRLRALFLILSLLLLLAGGFAWSTGRRWPAALAWGLALVPWTAWRMSGDLDLLWLAVEGGSTLVVQMRRWRERVPLDGAVARRLQPEEIAHLTRLVTSGGVAAGSGGFDSRELGEIDLYASDLTHAVLVEAGESRLVVTPDEPEVFLAEIGPAARRGA